MATPSAITSPFSNTVITGFDIQKPQVFNAYYRQYGDQFLSYFAFLKTLGFLTPVSSNVYEHWLEDWIHPSFQARNSVGSPGAGNPISITLSTDNVDTNNLFYPKLYDQVMFANEVTGIITAIDTTTPSAPIVTIEPDVATQNIGAVTAGDTIIIYSNRFGEGTDQPDGSLSKMEKVQWTAKIIKGRVQVTGTELCVESWVNASSDGLQQGQTYFALKGKADEEYRMQLRIGGALLFDQTVTNTDAMPQDDQVNTLGLYPWITSGGNTSTYVGGTFGLPEFDYMHRILTKYNAPAEMAFFSGIDLGIDVENGLSDVFAQNPIIFIDGKGMTYNQAFYQGDDAQLIGQSGESVDIGFKCLTKTGRRYHLVPLGELNNPNTYNAPGFPYGGLGLVCPLHKKETKTPMGGSRIIPAIGARYVQSPDGQYSRQMEAWVHGGAGNIQKTTGSDNMYVEYRSHIGSEYFGPKQFFAWTRE